MGETCSSCGAPDNGNEVCCGFCGKAFSQEIAASAIQCPQCRAPNRGNKQHCVRCNAWLVMACLFCGAASPCNAIQCVQCREVFQGMAERKQARDSQQQTQSIVDGVVSVVGSIAGVVSGHPNQPAPQQGYPQQQQQYPAQSYPVQQDASYTPTPDGTPPHMPDR